MFYTFLSLCHFIGLFSKSTVPFFEGNERWIEPQKEARKWRWKKGSKDIKKDGGKSRAKSKQEVGERNWKKEERRREITLFY